MIIMCAICNKEIDGIEIWYDPAMPGQRFRAYCHGATDECLITDHFIEMGLDFKDCVGVAFATKQIVAP